MLCRINFHSPSIMVNVIDIFLKSFPPTNILNMKLHKIRITKIKIKLKRLTKYIYV